MYRLIREFNPVNKCPFSYKWGKDRGEFFYIIEKRWPDFYTECTHRKIKRGIGNNDLSVVVHGWRTCFFGGVLLELILPNVNVLL